MKNYILYFILIMCSNIYSQKRYTTDSIKAYTLIKEQKNILENKGIVKANIISMFDDTGKIIIIWKKEKRYKALSVYYKGKKINKIRNQKLTCFDKKNIDFILKNPQFLSKTSDLVYNKKVHSFNKIYINIGNQFNSFFSNCLQNYEIKPLLSLYFSLKK